VSLARCMSPLYIASAKSVSESPITCAIEVYLPFRNDVGFVNTGGGCVFDSTSSHALAMVRHSDSHLDGASWYTSCIQAHAANTESGRCTCGGSNSIQVVGIMDATP